MAIEWLQVEVLVEGSAALLQHNDRLSNPCDPMTRALAKLTAKKKKTLEDHQAVAHQEFLGGLYCDGEGPYIPAKQIRGVLSEAAKRTRQGQQVKRGILCNEDCRLEYDGPRDPEKLWKAGFYDQRPVNVQRNKVLRTRPCFPMGWRCKLRFKFMSGELNAEDVESFLRIGGRALGFGDYRPEFGLFEVLEFRVVGAAA